MKENFTSPKPRCYLDWAATSIPDKNISGGGDISGSAESQIFGNPSSPHMEGRIAREALESARSRCACVLGVPPDKLYFTSGGTESNALILHSLLVRKGKGRLLYSHIEHPSVRENCIMMEKMGQATALIGVEKDGRVTETSLARALEKNPDTRFAAVMGVNNETGSIMDLKALVSVVRNNQVKTNLPIHFHSDLVQGIGKIPVDIAGWDVDSASISAHKLGGPRGIGLLYLKKPVESLYAGGEQERKLRPGTENTMGALALADILERRAGADTVKMEHGKARDRFRYLINNLQKIKDCSLIPETREGDDPRFSPWILQIRVRDIPGAVLVRALDEEGIAVSTGSACSSRSLERPVLAAMGLDKAARLEGIRISQGWSTTAADFDTLLAALEKARAIL